MHLYEFKAIQMKFYNSPKISFTKYVSSVQLPYSIQFTS